MYLVVRAGGSRVKITHLDDDDGANLDSGEVDIGSGVTTRNFRSCTVKHFIESQTHVCYHGA